MPETWGLDDAFLLGLPVVAPHELFFSITDRRGVIEQANSVFERLSRYDRTELIGAPHNLIRHDMMPAGVFRIMWDLLAAGRPVAAYVTNRSRGGRPYSVFATITPVGERMLSVRTAPCEDGLRSVAESIYREVRPLERAASARGMSRRAVGELGAGELITRLRAAGFASYEDFVRHAVPAEGAARVLAATGPATGSTGTGVLGTLSTAVRGIDGQLAGLWHTLERHQALADQVGDGAARVREAVAGLHDATRAMADASAWVCDRAPVLERSARAMTLRAAAVGDRITALVDELERVRTWLLDLRFRIALARLHNDMVRLFLAELAGGAGAGDSRAALPLLCAALDEDVTALTEDMAAVSVLLTELRDHVDRGSGELRELRRGLASWRLLVPRYGVTRELDGGIEPVDRHLDLSHEQLLTLAALARQCAADAEPMDPAALRAAIGTIRRTVQAGLAEE
ncbi:PAS domain-containing protein [Cellulomonas denverensis]|uniref:PAS domain-containing protein n=1 Tax=Cellulomonas denverensis TaxID=264297 RepID=A0A7X6KU23_9CELL|nr:PAS domain-containing protein [Cellulomonas denverensis]NKY22080.1 hypothetical protein [Cellulomonas denverensis]GIG26159.1 hypothetical protein Cde04nite_24030 [Cellulomonas denverensis]